MSGGQGHMAWLKKMLEKKEDKGEPLKAPAKSYVRDKVYDVLMGNYDVEAKYDREVYATKAMDYATQIANEL